MHLIVEAMRRAYADRAAYLGDADFVSVPVKGLTRPQYAGKAAQGDSQVETRCAGRGRAIRRCLKDRNHSVLRGGR